MQVETPYTDLWLSVDDWVEAFAAPAPGTPHNEGRDEVRTLRRADGQAWTLSDLPLLDAARQRLGDPETSRRRRRHEAAVAAERKGMAEVVDDLVAGALDLIDGREADLEGVGVVTMLLLRCPSRSFTIVGDRAQARHGFAESWEERLGRVGLDRMDLTSLSINYRTPVEVMAEAEPVIRAVLPDANVPTSVRSTGIPVERGPVSDLGSILHTWLAAHAEGTACVISTAEFEGGAPAVTSPVRWLTPELAKGLEFDLVVLVEPEAFGAGIEGTVDRYVAMTRATQRLVVLTSPDVTSAAGTRRTVPPGVAACGC